ncbi:MAG: hypothetical protein HY651_13215 [Acidobacteria bacterium]|nr:hypothetical protein [Acidobacteriota bacterium]
MLSKTHRIRIVLGRLMMIAYLPGAIGAAYAQVTVVSLGDVSGGVGTEVIVPVLLNPATTETRVGSISSTIGFDRKLVTFLRAEKGFLLDGVKGKFQTKVQENAAKPETSTLQLEIATEGEPRKALREGLVVSLIFKINGDAPAKTVVPLRFEKVSAGSADTASQPIEPITSTPGSIEVLSPESIPYVSCFFFTH